ncbi:MAG: hypothetical protein A3E83_03910 [Gammaproteobacteria bacterium RIFCSPHIGHO2_12_FULL_41_20]|nr:MAG: hypothetical protein A3E83_03910 [Gammaproteobacteria bacterium RIFCSPHIGHO2_12_FULL_41_20]
MTENLLQKLEEKAMMLLSELETLRNEVQQLKKENSTLKMERESSLKKLQDLVSVFDTITLGDDTPAGNQISLSSREYAAA